MPRRMGSKIARRVMVFIVSLLLNFFHIMDGFRLKGTAAVRDQKIKEQADAYKPPVVNQHELALAKKRQANISLQPFGAQ